MSKTFQTHDYGKTGLQNYGGVYYWRGYQFKVSKKITVTHLIGGSDISDVGETCRTGLYKSGNGYLANELLGWEYTPIGSPTEVELSNPINLEPDTWYFISQGKDEYNDNDMYYTWGIYDSDLKSSEDIISDFEPTNGECYRWNTGNETFIINNNDWDYNKSTVAIGFIYEPYTNTWVKVGGEWAQSKKYWVKTNGNWKEIKSVVPKVGNEWKL